MAKRETNTEVLTRLGHQHNDARRLADDLLLDLRASFYEAWLTDELTVAQAQRLAQVSQTTAQRWVRQWREENGE
jgi:hypothetical protein